MNGHFPKRKKLLSNRRVGNIVLFETYVRNEFIVQAKKNLTFAKLTFMFTHSENRSFGNHYA